MSGDAIVLVAWLALALLAGAAWLTQRRLTRLRRGEGPLALTPERRWMFVQADRQRRLEW